MKKLRILVLLIILAFSFTVKAEVEIELDCNNKEIKSDKSVTCTVTLVYGPEGINDIEIGYDTNLDISFIPVKGFTINKGSNSVSIHTDEKLYDDVVFSADIIEFTLTSNDKCSEKESISLKNIIINNEDTIKVNGVSKSFDVEVIKEEVVEEVKSNICTLDSISIDDKLINNFDKNKFEYKEIEIKANNEKVFVDAKRSNDKASASGLGDVIVPNSETTERDIIVLAEDGTKCVYKLFIKNLTPKETLPDEKEKSNDNTLKTLELYNNKKKLDFKFDNKKDSFDFTVDDINKITIKAALNDTKASFVNKFGPRDVNLDLIDNEVLIKVQAENGDIKTYKLNIHVNKKSNDNTLSLLKINDKEIDLENLEVKLSNDVTKTKIEAVANDLKATIKYEDIDLEVGTNELKIIVTAEDGSTKEYSINIIREEEVKKQEKVEEIKEDIKEDSSSLNILCYIIFGIGLVAIIVVIVYLIKKRKRKDDVNIEEI